MQVSYFCNHCGIHLRKGDHSACRKALKAQRPSEASRLTAGERNRKRYADGSLGEVLAKAAKPD